MSAPAARDVGQLLDACPFSAFQKLVVLLAALSIVLDGFDGQLIGYAIPLIIKEWGISRDAFAPVVAAGLIGMGIGSACAGLFADRFGRRWAVIASVFVFGIATSCIGLANDLLSLAAMRFVAGLGIGGALPSATTLSAEFTPLRHRTFAVTATIVCVPLGGMLAGLFAGGVLPVFGWRALFFIGGGIAVALGITLLFALPESARFLARRPARWAELSRLLARMSLPGDSGATYTDRSEQLSERRPGVAALLDRGLARDTLAIWAAFFMCLLAVYSAFSWLPTMLVAEGLDLAIAASGLTAYNLGGVLGALCCAIVVTRYGSRWPLLLCCGGAAGSAFLLQQISVRQHAQLLIVGLGVHGLFVNAVQSLLFALCAYVYPTSVRATGTAAGLAIGRLGAILSAFAGAAVITAGGALAYLTMLGGAMILVFAALAMVRRHIPPLSAR